MALIKCGHVLTLVLLLVLTQVSCLDLHDGREDNSVTFSNQWIVSLELDPDNEAAADILAAELGYENMGQIDGFDNYYLMRKLDHPETADTESDVQTRSLEDEVKVLFAQQLFHKIRVKRRPPDDFYDVQEILRNLEMINKNEIDNDDRGIPPELLELWDQEEKSHQNDQVEPLQERMLFNDALWDHQWYMHDTRTRSNLPEIDLNILPAYQLGYTGRGIKVTVLDDGLEHLHDDLRANYDSSISWDYNNGTKGDPDPSPRYPRRPGDFPNSHGTRCAGEIAMIANNRICGVGIAHEAKLGGIRMLDGHIDDRIEGMSLQHALDKVDIYTASWGPSDDGKTVEAPGHLAQQALLKGITKGRNGKGAIYVWAGGNGGMHMDNCNCDGYTSSIYTVSIGSASEQGMFPWYGEMCSSTLATTYSSGAYSDQKIATTDNNNSCTLGHTGTSAAAPLAAGMIALTLEANPNLTWRDVQHIVVWTSSITSLTVNQGWRSNAAGLRYNHRFGFGIMNGYELVTTAKDWENVGRQKMCTVKLDDKSSNDKVVSSGKTAKVYFNVTGCQAVNFMEHLQLVTSVEYPNRGCLEIVIQSPAGTMSQLLTSRPEDMSRAGFSRWNFMSVHFWAENPNGQWTVYFVDRTCSGIEGKIGDLSLILYGTTEMPKVIQTHGNGPRNTVPREKSLEQFYADEQLQKREENRDLSELNWNDLVGQNVAF